MENHYSRRKRWHSKKSRNDAGITVKISLRADLRLQKSSAFEETLST
jgi:hypothetical protein